MAKQPKRAIKLFGTEVPEPKVKSTDMVRPAKQMRGLGGLQCAGNSRMQNKGASHHPRLTCCLLCILHCCSPT